MDVERFKSEVLTMTRETSAPGDIKEPRSLDEEHENNSRRGFRPGGPTCDSALAPSGLCLTTCENVVHGRHLSIVVERGGPDS
jgi:hypothetical protein